MNHSKILLLSALAIGACKTDKEKKHTYTNQPNILWINAEDMSPDFSCYGETVIKTPNIDKLASEGIQFMNAHVTAPVCSASRSAIVTGMYQTSIGAHQHRSSRGSVKILLPEPVKMIPQIFQENGYFTSNAGYDYSAKTDYNFVWNPAVYNTAPKIKLDGSNWEELFKGKKEGQPWFVHLQIAGGKNRNAPIDNPVSEEDVKLAPYYPNVEEFRHDQATYLNSVIHVDNVVGKVIEKLKETGEWNNTIVFFFTDHGQRMYRHKQYLYDGGTHIPLIVAGPGIEKGKVRENLISHIDIPASSLHLAGIDVPEWMEGQTFFGDNFEEREYLIAARDRCDWTKDRIRSVRTKKFKYIRNYHPEYSYMQSNYKDDWPTVVTGKTMYANDELDDVQARFYKETRPEEEFYILGEDEHEIDNQIDNPEYEDEIQKMRQILNTWIKESGDQGETPESNEAYEQACLHINTGTPFEGFPLEVSVTPMNIEGETFSKGTTKLVIKNGTKKELITKIKISTPNNIQATEHEFTLKLQGEEWVERPIQLSADKETHLSETGMTEIVVSTQYQFNESSVGTYQYPVKIKPSNSYSIQKSKHPLTIDGDLSDWSILPYSFESGDISFNTVYDEQYVYFGIQVIDDKVLSEKGKLAWEQDGIEVRVDFRPDPYRSNSIGTSAFSNHFLIATCPGKNGTPISLYTASTIKRSLCPDMFEANGIQYKHKITEKGHVAEIAIPVAMANKYAKKVWDAFRLHIIASDSNGEKISKYMWQPDWRNKEKDIVGSGTFFKE